MGDVIFLIVVAFIILAFIGPSWSWMHSQEQMNRAKYYVDKINAGAPLGIIDTTEPCPVCCKGAHRGHKPGCPMRKVYTNHG